ncbi:hypothetical protein C1645_840313 [Glomus cerebriforme]|uniref:Protein kinase domain-containing protein n=1 Tax=Glomus cerebriforme TaxID=658196 RepID=A0A397S4E5_9GLOM|nr:hypothetical protein C1645_840313 [Glomus cerebriforme]
MNETEIVTVVEIKPEQLMVNIIARSKIDDNGQVKLTDVSENMIELYETVVCAPTYEKNAHHEYEKIKRIIRQAFRYMVVNKLRYGMITTYARTWFLRHNQASFLECMYYFEDISRENPTIDSSKSPPMTDYEDDQDSYTSDHPDQPSDNDEDDEFKPSKRQKTSKPIERKSTQNTQKLAQSSLKVNTWDAKKDNIKKFNHQSDDELLVNMKNYDCGLFCFGKTLRFGRSGRVIKARLFRKSGALKMVDLYKNESFASKKRDITEVEKQSAVNGLLAIHALGVKYGDIRLENIMEIENGKLK